MIETGISFDGIHSYRDLDLILSSVEIPPASPKAVFVDIPGANGSVDLTEALGEVKYSDRTGVKFTFHMNPAGDLSEAAWEAKKRQISNRLNGLRCKIVLDKDPEYFWDGRCAVSEHASDRKMRKIVVGARVAPYKLKRNLTNVFVPFCGKNLLDPSYLENTSKFVQNNLAYISVPILLKPNTTYTLSYSAIAQPTSQIVLNVGYAPWEGTSKENILAKVFNVVNAKTTPASKTFTTTDAFVYYLQYYMNGDNLSDWTVDEWFTRMCSDLQLEMSSRATTYEPYEAIATQEVTLTNARKTVCPSIIVSDEATVTFSGGESTLAAGTHKILDLQLREGSTPVTVSGTGAIAFVYQEGDL